MIPFEKLIKKIIKRKEKVRIVFSQNREVIVKKGKEEYKIRNIDLDKVQTKVLYVYDKVRTGEILRYPEALWLLKYQYLIVIQKDGKISVRGNNFEFEAKGQFVSEIIKNAERSNSVEEIIKLVLSHFQEVLSQLEK